MTKGFLYVESRPSAPERIAEYNDWYDHVHLPEVLAVEGFVAATRLHPVDDSGPYVALYQMQSADLGETFARLANAAYQGLLHISDAIEMDPLPTVRLLKVISHCDGVGAAPATTDSQE